MADVSARVTFSIDELRLEGLPPAQRFAIAAALESELGLLFAERGIPAGLSAGHAPEPGTVDPTGLGPADLGRSIARSIYLGWK